MSGLDTAVAGLPLFAGAAPRWTAAPGAVASPMYRGVDAQAAVAEDAAGARYLVKRYHPEMLAAAGVPGIDPATAIRASRQAAALGMAPAVRHADAATGLLVFDYLAPPWREARLDDLAGDVTLAAVMAAMRRVHAGPLLGAALDPFAWLRAEHAAALAAGALLPPDAAWLLAQAALIEAAMRAAGWDVVPCRGTGLASDLLLGPGAAVMLLDFDHAGDGDPYFDLAMLLNEAFAFEPPMAAAIEQFAGAGSPALLARCRLYGVIDDVLWGLRGLRLAHVSPRGGVEFFKYGEWRLLRARMNLRAWDFEAWLRRL